MNNKKKIIIFILILLICPMGLIIKDKLQSKEDVYVLTEEENSSKDNIEQTDVKEEHNITDKEITVYVSGEVNKPGIVTLIEGDRLAVAVEKVGGTTKKADLNGVNMAVKLKDEMHYIIPKIGESSKDNNSNSDISSNDNKYQNGTSKTSQININTATLEELDKLPGVGEATANKIISHRSDNGEFKSIEEIKEVNGIGDKKFEEIKNLICVK